MEFTQVPRHYIQIIVPLFSTFLALFKKFKKIQECWLCYKEKLNQFFVNISFTINLITFYY